MEATLAPSLKQGQYLTFHVKDQVFGLEIMRVREIIEFRPLTRIPLVPEFISGILNLRGNVVPVIDVSGRFGWEKTQTSRLTCIIITELEYDGNRLEIGLVVDAVNAVVNFSAESIEDSPKFGARIRTDFISQVGKVDGNFVLLLSIANLLNIEEIQSLREIAGETTQGEK